MRTMRIINLYVAAAAIMVALIVSSCKDDIVKYVANEGEEVSFGAGLAVDSRTYYGPEEDVGGNKKVFPIYWNSKSEGYDKIFVYAPNALAGRNQSFYEVQTAGSGDQSISNTVVKMGAAGIQWGNSSTPFYGFYPGDEKFKISAADNSITATLPSEQTVSFGDGRIDPVPPAADGEAAHKFEPEPDMSCCMMLATTEASEPTNNKIPLQYKPFSTVLDITISGPNEDHNTINPVYVTSVTVEADAQITGQFSYDFLNKIITCNGENPSDKVIRINTMVENSDGYITGVPLNKGQSLNLKAFMIPNPNIKTLKVHVYTSRFEIFTQSLRLGSGTSTDWLKPSQIHKVSLPYLKTGEAKFNYETWMSQLDPNIYIYIRNIFAGFLFKFL